MCAVQDDFGPIHEALRTAEGIVRVSAVYRSEMTECFRAFFDRLRRCEAGHNRVPEGKRCLPVACAGSTGRGSLECLTQMERGLTHVGMRVCDRFSLVRCTREDVLPVQEEAGKTCVRRLEEGFDMDD